MQSPVIELFQIGAWSSRLWVIISVWNRCFRPALLSANIQHYCHPTWLPFTIPSKPCHQSRHFSTIEGRLRGTVPKTRSLGLRSHHLSCLIDESTFFIQIIMQHVNGVELHWLHPPYSAFGTPTGSSFWRAAALTQTVPRRSVYLCNCTSIDASVYRCVL